MPQVDDEYRKKASLARLRKMPLPFDPSGAVGGVGGVARRMATPLIGRIAGPTMQRALGVAESEGRQLAGGWLSEAAAQGTRFSQGSVNRSGKAAQEELFNFLADMERMGVKPATANKFLRGFSKYVDNKVEGIAEMGGDVGRSAAGGMDAKEALVKRLLSRLGGAAEDSFF
jgi:hypothetical protein